MTLRMNLKPAREMPPPGYALEEKQKPATVYVVHHTKSGGTTDLPPCPK